MRIHVLVGKPWRILERTDRTCDIVAYNDNIKGSDNVSYCVGCCRVTRTLWTGVTYVIVINEALYEVKSNNRRCCQQHSYDRIKYSKRRE